MSSWGTLFFFVAISGISLLILSPFLYRALVFYSYPYHNIGIPSDVEIALPQVEPNAILSSANSVFQRLAVNDVLRVASLILFFVSASVIVRFRRKGSFNQAIELVKVGTAALLGELLLFLLSAISPNDLPFYPQPLLLYFPLYFFLAVFNFTSYKFLSSFLSEKVFVKILNHKPRKKFLAASLSSMLLLVIYAPFLYQAIALDGQMLYGSYAVYAVTTEHDFRLLLWMRENFTRDATILIDNFQSGSFIPSIADCKAVFPSFGSSYSISYQRLVALIEGRAINTTVYDLMKSFNVTHIYVGEGVSPVDNWKHRWEPKLFLGNPNFHLVKNYGDAYLFRLDYVKPNIVFLDDFEYASWNQNGWQTNFLGNGLGNVTITANLGYNDSKSLKITAQVVPTEAEMKYARWVGREILVANNSRVSLSFYFNATQGFNGDDTFAALVSNVYRNQSMVITTSNGIYRNYRYAIPLNASQGFFEERDLTAAWHRMFNSSLPNPFILEFVNWDFDGVKNVAYLDNVTITSTPDA